MRTRPGGRAILEPAFVLAVGLAMLVLALRYVAVYGSPIPYKDDYAVLGRLGRPRVLALDWLWSMHNEHRIPLPRLLFVGIAELTRDLRWLMVLEVLLLALAALVLVLAVRRRRGSTRATDAFFPLLFLGLAHHENLLSAFQIAFVLPSVIAAVILAAVAVAPPDPDRRVAIRVGALLLLLPACGGAGALQVPPIALWLALEGISARRSDDPARRRSAAVFLVAAVAATLFLALYFLAPSKTAASSVPVPTIRTLVNALDLLAFGAGRLTWGELSLVRWAMLLLAAATLVRLVRPRAGGGSRLDLGLLACGLGGVLLALGVGWGRAEQMLTGIAPRYVTLFAPFLAFVYVAWSDLQAGAAGRAVQWTLLLGMIALFPSSLSRGRSYGEMRRRASDQLFADADAGLAPEELAERHWRSFSIGEALFSRQLEHLRHLGVAPYRVPEEGREVDAWTEFPFRRFGAAPVEVRSGEPVTRRIVLERSVVLVHAPATFVFEIPPRARRVRGGFGVPPLAYANPKRAVRGLRFLLEHAPDPGSRRILFEELLDPARRVEDQEIRTFAVDLPPDAKGRLELRIEPSSEETAAMNWGFWTGLEFEME